MVSNVSRWRTRLELHQMSSAVTAPTLKKTHASHHSALGVHSKPLAVWKAKLIWGCISKSTASRLREVFSPFGLRGKAHLKCCVLLWTPLCKQHQQTGGSPTEGYGGGLRSEGKEGRSRRGWEKWDFSVLGRLRENIIAVYNY